MTRSSAIADKARDAYTGIAVFVLTRLQLFVVIRSIRTSDYQVIKLS